MDQSNGSDRDLRDILTDEEDDAALAAAIDEGIRAADEGRLVPADEVRKMVARWNSEFSTRSRR